MNNENLKPINERADFIELSRKGGINSGIARRRLAQRRKIAELYLEVALFGTESKARGNRGKSKYGQSTKKSEKSNRERSTKEARKTNS